MTTKRTEYYGKPSDVTDPNLYERNHVRAKYYLRRIPILLRPTTWVLVHKNGLFLWHQNLFHKLSKKLEWISHGQKSSPNVSMFYGFLDENFLYQPMVRIRVINPDSATWFGSGWIRNPDAISYYSCYCCSGPYCARWWEPGASGLPLQGHLLPVQLIQQSELWQRHSQHRLFKIVKRKLCWIRVQIVSILWYNTV